MECRVSGRCYCGEVEFEVHIPEGEKPIFTAYCHCDSCRRAHAAPLYQVACVDSRMFTITKGAEHVVDFQKEGSTIVRAFSNCCGTRILNRFPKWRIEGVEPLAWFPALLSTETQKNLPEVLVPKKNNQVHDCVLNREWVLAALNEAAEG